MDMSPGSVATLVTGQQGWGSSSKQYNSKAFAMAMSPSVTLDQSERRFAAPKDQPATGEVVLASVRVACDRRLSAPLVGNKLGLSLIDLPFRMEHLGNSWHTLRILELLDHDLPWSTHSSLSAINHWDVTCFSRRMRRTTVRGFSCCTFQCVPVRKCFMTSLVTRACYM